MGHPKIDVDGVEDGEEGETPRNSVNDNQLSAREELVDDGTEKEEVDKRPDKERPGGRSDVRFLPIIVDGRGTSYRVDIRTQEEKVDDDICDFEENTIFPSSVRHGERRKKGWEMGSRKKVRVLSTVIE